MGSAPPWFRFWGKDFDASTATWTVAEVGAYVRLLIAQWEAGPRGLPEDPERLQMACRATAREWAGLWPAIEGKFPVNGDGARRNSRLEEVRRAHLEASEKLSKAGAKGAAARWGGQCDRNGQAIGDANGQAYGDSMASSVSSSDSDSDSSSDAARGGSGGKSSSGTEHLAAPLRSLSPEQLQRIEREARSKGLDIEGVALACEEYWRPRDDAKPPKGKPRWFSRLQNWLRRERPSQQVADDPPYHHRRLGSDS